MKFFKCSFIAFNLFFTISTELYGQQAPVSNHFFLNPYLSNPSYAGFNDNAEVYIIHRRQWAGIEGAPVTSFFSFHLPMKKKSFFRS